MCRRKLPIHAWAKCLHALPRWFVLPRRWIDRSVSVPTGLLLPARLLRPERVSCGLLLRKRCDSVPLFYWQLQRSRAVRMHAMCRWKLPIRVQIKCLPALPRWFVLPRRWIVRSVSVPTGLLLPAQLLRPERLSCGLLLRRPRHSIRLSSKHVQRIPQADVAGAVHPLPPRPTIRLRILRVLCALPSQPV
jgi:hypothetical protein